MLVVDIDLSGNLWQLGSYLFKSDGLVVLQHVKNVKEISGIQTNSTHHVRKKVGNKVDCIHQ